ncbi:hypothetical protein LTR78_006652 [Recurvomyces mirabilis]|uniref:Alpha/beta hydrolase fold-3 domain-containing protein n=1 Tax=Recurvomyces mirabilis TaxID=574656 RepID=A0AAE1BZM3_9PEZI|nr:hypothetical protein LTR78_006652 [Recurvomyces mirabilis]KAK5151459.1 hypothetical protein LTS14_009302 [Recurvomyces mirabilis]
MAPAPQPSLLDKVALLPVAGNAILAILYNLITRPIASGSRPVDAFRDAMFSAMRSFLSSIDTPIEQWSASTTEAEYLAVAKKQGFAPDTEVLASGVKLHRLGVKNPQYTILYLHGGGFNLPAMNGHFEWLLDVINDLSPHASVGVVFLSYTLSPKGQYPLQLQQATESLQWLITKQNISPSKIIIGGDSAGGNLSMAVLSHVLHPHPEVPKLELKEPLAGALLICPWVHFEPSDDGVDRNQHSDLVTPVAAKRWSANYMGNAKLDNYTQAADADEKWFSGLDKVVRDVLVYGGGGEVLIDSIKLFGAKLKRAHSKAELVVLPKAAHIDMIIDKSFGYKGKAEGTQLIESWMSAAIS